MNIFDNPQQGYTEETQFLSAMDFGPTLLRACGLKKAFGRQTILADVNVELRAGEVVLLRGENGSGKTTLLNILTGNLEPEAGQIEYLADEKSRTYRFPRAWHEEINPWDHFRPEFVARTGIGRTWQDLRLFSSQSILNNIAIAAPGQPDQNPLDAFISMLRPNQGMQPSYRRALDLLEMLGLGERKHYAPNALSYGQAKRGAIARAVAAEGTVLFLDEPLAGLDQNGIDDLLALLRFLVVHNKLTLVIVEHVLSQLPLRSLLTTTWTLNQGRLTSSAHSASADGWKNSGSSWFPLPIPDDCEVVDEELPRGAVLSRIRPRLTKPDLRRPIFELRDLVIHRGSRLLWGTEDGDVVKGLSVSIQPGETAVLRAPNGWGKTTLLNTIAGLHPATSGTVRMLDKDLTGCKPWERIQKGLRVSLGPSYFFNSLTVREILQLAQTQWPFKSDESFFSKRANELSGGQRVLLALIGSTQISGHRLLLLDEPFSMLDSLNIENAASLMRPAADSSLLITVPLTVH